MALPLDGITVVSLEHAIAAPFCTRQLADLGARVIKVERPGSGDFARLFDALPEGGVRVRGVGVGEVSAVTGDGLPGQRAGH
ncbi:hypothetical protein FHW18_000508 [Pigmentiphaga litoralis]|uniref:CoA transferase n=1 Tax=Pigmentiphaga litoralis TaxID=516702 RepID=A0A7Y9IQM8_9BURK|nr:hypothetical protein [Pigmentiphaga litoralis]NYE81237.1 hypothetical protein [Pigmentiphaga litoralis]